MLELSDSPCDVLMAQAFGQDGKAERVLVDAVLSQGLGPAHRADDRRFPLLEEIVELELPQSSKPLMSVIDLDAGGGLGLQQVLSSART